VVEQVRTAKANPKQLMFIVLKPRLLRYGGQPGNANETNSLERGFSLDMLFSFIHRTGMKSLLFALTLLFAAATIQAQVGEQAPAFSLKDKDGKVFSAESMKGKIIVLNFWATWCPPCRAEIPAFKSVYEKYKGKGVEIVGVSLDHKGWDVIRPFLDQHKINYPVVLGGADIAKAYGNVRSIPTTFIIDRKGKVIDSHVGAMSEDQLVKSFEKLL
jgi:cytochrome c biogenesis protein CcmG/thiol:disulfide interchange protein DsbE